MDVQRLAERVERGHGGPQQSPGRNSLEALAKIACMGVDIACCGLCLEFFDLKEKLEIGRTTNMLEVAESLQSAGRIIRM